MWSEDSDSQYKTILFDSLLLASLFHKQTKVYTQPERQKERENAIGPNKISPANAHNFTGSRKAITYNLQQQFRFNLMKLMTRNLGAAPQHVIIKFPPSE